MTVSSQEDVMSTLHIEPFYDARTHTLTYVVFDLVSRDAVVIDAGRFPAPHANGQRWRPRGAR